MLNHMAVVNRVHAHFASTVDMGTVMNQARLIECRLCGELKDESQYAPNRRQCNRCRNRYTERVREIEKRRAYGRVRAARYRLKQKQELLNIEPIVSCSTQQ